jgi:CBS domain-containing protein
VSHLKRDSGTWVHPEATIAVPLRRRCKVTSVKDVLDEKGREIFSTSPDASVYEALKLMAENNIASLVVVEDGILVGIISERIYAREIILKGRTSLGTLVREIMSTRLVYARPDQSVQECMAVMTAKGVRHLPVLQDEELIGIVSIGDMVKSVLGDQAFTIEQYEHYMHGDR